MSYLNDSSFTLAPEDVEYILQVTAVDADTLLYPGPDSLTGYGKLNAGAALQLVEKPFRKVLHFSSDTIPSAVITETLVSSGDTVELAEFYDKSFTEKYSPGKYIVNTFEITSQLNHMLNPKVKILGYWPISSLSGCWAKIDSLGKILPRERVLIDSLDQQESTLVGYRYEVLDSFGNTIGWWPQDSSAGPLRMSYSILVHDSLATNLEQVVEPQFSLTLLPNPANDIQELEITSSNYGQAKISIYDIHGRLIKQVPPSIITPGEQTISVDLSSWPAGIYVYRVEMNGEYVTLKGQKL